VARKSFTLNELIERLEDIREEAGNGEMEVFLAHQPNYPFEFSIAEPKLVDINPANYDEEGRELTNSRDRDDPKYVVYIPEGGHQTYLRTSRQSVWD
jgi:hypothetical protein